MTAVTDIVVDQGFLPIESEIPAGMTIAEYRARRTRPATRWERARVVVLGAAVVGLAAETLATARSRGGLHA